MNAKTKNIAAAAVLILLGGILLSLRVGATTEYDEQILLLLRMPRTIAAIAVGGGLAVAGTLIQASLGNPLADPYTIGIASAAALGAVIGSLFKGHPILGSGVFAFLFSMGGLTMLSIWLRRSFRHATEVLLAGVVVGFFFTALASLVMAMNDPAMWSSSVVWLMGALGRLSLAESVTSLLLMLIISTVGWFHWKPLDLIAIDETSAESSGVDVAMFRKRIFFMIALMTAICVSTSGVIGFLGLIVPHALRRLGIRGHFLLIPFSFVSGAGFLLCSDVFARVVARPSEIPVGVVLALIGAPAFLVLARSKISSNPSSAL
ncbi:MAG: iron ABC transporter permease [Deltaproteobacteria bacterium]|nr:iron ABC transporter permease [Deltaproteobacteria bacterium]